MKSGLLAGFLQLPRQNWYHRVGNARVEPGGGTRSAVPPLDGVQYVRSVQASAGSWAFATIGVAGRRTPGTRWASPVTISGSASVASAASATCHSPAPSARLVPSETLRVSVGSARSRDDA